MMLLMLSYNINSHYSSQLLSPLIQSMKRSLALISVIYMNSGQVAPDGQSIAQLDTNHKALFGGITAEILFVLTALDDIRSMMSATFRYSLLYTHLKTLKMFFL